MKSTVKNAYAKLNLFLDVTGRRDDGYHNIRSVMQTVSLSDIVAIESVFGGGIVLSDSENIKKQDNLCYIAAERFFERLKKSYGVKITLKKSIPMTAGLGGGSADAAAVLRGLNELFEYPFSVFELRKIALKIGADVPFCVCGGTARAEGIGELIEPLSPLEGCFFTITEVKGKFSTAEAYRRLDLTGTDAKDELFDKLISGLEAKDDIEKISGYMYNCFEQLYNDRLFKLKELIKSLGAFKAMMSGSGLATFGVFKTKQEADIAADQLTKCGFVTHAAEPVKEYC